MTKLSVNLNKIALLRNARGRDFPNLLTFAELALEAGAAGLTIHPRPDERHARFADILPLKALCERYQAELNIEGYPSKRFMAAVLEAEVTQVTLVPDAPEQLTSDHGWQVRAHTALLSETLAALAAKQIRSSLFMDLDLDEITAAKQIGADRIELHTESYARRFEKQAIKADVGDFFAAYQHANALGLGVNAGHDLDLANLPYFLQQMPVSEVSIGHALTVEALLFGFSETVKRYVLICQQATA